MASPGILHLILVGGEHGNGDGLVKLDTFKRLKRDCLCSEDF